MRKRSLRRTAWSLALLAVPVLSGCFAVADVDRFQVACTGNSGETRDFVFDVNSLTPHAGQLFEMKVVRTNGVPGDPGTPVAAIVYDGIPDENPVIVGTLRDALAPGQYAVRFWGAFGGSRDFMLGSDHSWIFDVGENGCFTFRHMGPFVADISPTDDAARGNVTLTLSGLGDHSGRPLIWRVREQLGPEVGLFRLDTVPMTLPEARVMTLPDIAVNDSTYELHGFVDVDNNGVRGPDEPQFSPAAIGAAPNAAFVIDLGLPD